MADPNVPERRAGLEDVDELSLETFRVFRDTMRLNGQAMARGFAAKGAHIGQAACLRVLDVHNGITQREMADILGVSRPSISNMVQAVEKSGAVVRKPDEADHRLTRVYLTEEGRAAAIEMRGVLGSYISETFAQLPEEERRELIRLLGHLGEHIRHVLSTMKEGTCEE